MRGNELQQPEEREGIVLKWEGIPVPRILVVDDEPTVLQLNVRILASAGYEVEGAADGAAAWDSLQVGSYDLLVTDNKMPKLTGVELIARIHAAGMRLPVIMATGTAPEAEFIRRPELKPAATLLKPYPAADFLGTVKTVLCAAML